MTETRDWQRNRQMWINVLEKQTGETLPIWNQRIKGAQLETEAQLRTWLTRRRVTGYARQLLVMERFGYPDFIVASAEELIAGQYADRPQLRPIYDAVIRAAEACGPIVVQARKTYVSLVSPRRTFARVLCTNKARVDLGLRLEGQRPTGRLQPSRIHETMRVQIGLTAVRDVDAEVRQWLKRAYAASAV